LDKTTAELKQTKTTLEATTKERDTAVQTAQEATTRANKLNEDLNKTRTERDDAQREVAAFRASGLTPEQALNAAKQIKGLQDSLAGSQEENTLLGKRIKKLNADLAFYRDPSGTIELPATIKGKVLVSDPKWHFIVINAGEDQGVVESIGIEEIASVGAPTRRVRHCKSPEIRERISASRRHPCR